MNFNNQYLSYNEYKELNGTLDEVSFNLLEYDVRKIIDKRTFNRLKKLDTILNDVKMCVFQMIKLKETYKPLKEKDKSITSENIDGYSVSYAKQEKQDIDIEEKELNDIMEKYLAYVIVDGVPILYAGVMYVD